MPGFAGFPQENEKGTTRTNTHQTAEQKKGGQAKTDAQTRYMFILQKLGLRKMLNTSKTLFATSRRNPILGHKEGSQKWCFGSPFKPEKRSLTDEHVRINGVQRTGPTPFPCLIIQFAREGVNQSVQMGAAYGWLTPVKRPSRMSPRPRAGEKEGGGRGAGK